MMRWRAALFLSAIALVSPGQSSAQVTAEQAISTAQTLVSVKTCSAAPSKDEITVCGADNSKFRLPLPTGRTPFSDRVQGEVPRASIDVAANRECGVHRGQRRCGLRELRDYGYGGGSVPIRALVMLAKAAVIPDAEVGPLAGLPITAEERK